MISKLYKRPLDTLLATWGLSLAMQQAFRSIFGAKEVSATLPDWLMGSYKPSESIDIPLNGLFMMLVTVILTGGIFILLFRSRWGLQVRATMQNRAMSGAVGINTRKVDRMTFALGCGVAGVGGRRLYDYRLDQPYCRFSVHRRHLFGGGIRRRAKLDRNDCLRLFDRANPVDAGIFLDWIDGQGDHPIGGDIDPVDAAPRLVFVKDTQIACRLLMPNVERIAYECCI